MHWGHTVYIWATGGLLLLWVCCILPFFQARVIKFADPSVSPFVHQQQQCHNMHGQGGKLPPYGTALRSIWRMTGAIVLLCVCLRDVRKGCGKRCCLLILVPYVGHDRMIEREMLQVTTHGYVAQHEIDRGHLHLRKIWPVTPPTRYLDAKQPILQGCPKTASQPTAKV